MQSAGVPDRILTSRVGTRLLRAATEPPIGLAGFILPQPGATAPSDSLAIGGALAKGGQRALVERTLRGVWPPGFKPRDDLSPAEWIGPRLLPWGAEMGTPVTSIVPVGYDAYVRVFHPASAAGADHAVTWQEVADWSGGTFHPLAQFDAMADPVRPDPGPPPFDSAPSVGRLPHAICEVLVRELARLTETPSACYFAIWDGDGILSTGSSVTLLSVRGLRRRVRHRHRT